MILTIAQASICKTKPIHTSRIFSPQIPSMSNTLYNLHAGNDLPICAQPRASLQCCTREYINRVREAVKEELLDGLREEFEETVEAFEQVVGRMITCKFITEYRNLTHDATYS